MILHLTVKKKWFDKIASGEKKVEYREIKDYWISRLCISYKVASKKMLEFKKYDEIHFKNGYSKKVPFMRVNHKYTVVVNGKDTDLKIDRNVFAIYLGNVLELSIKED